MNGRTLGHYKILASLGAGGMGEVYRAQDTRLGREVALKLLPPEVATDHERLARLEREARALAALNHPGIVTVFAVEEAEGTRFLTMELVEGAGLDTLIPPRGMPPDRLLAVGLAIADAVAAAHAKGIVHRDLKPGNVMVTAEGRVKVLDFGLARWLSWEAEGAASQLATDTQTQEGRLLGTVPYMSPEQVEGKPADVRSDVFALGVMLYEMAAGKRPFGGDSAASVMSAILRDTPVSLADVRRDLPSGLGRVVRRCLSKDPGHRFQTAIDVRNELEELARESSTTTAPVTETHGPPIAKRGRRLPVWLPVGAALVLLAAAGGVLLLRGRGGSGAPSPAAAIRSLAVLPFDNLMHDPAQDYFVDGMQETLITTLAQIQPLRVISRTSAMRFRNTDKAVPEIARELGVDAVIEGSVLRAGGRVRITAQLIRGATDEHVWAQSYDRDVENVLSLLSEVAEAIAAEVRIALTPEQRKLLTGARPVRPEVQEEYLLGKHAWNSFTSAGWEQALVHFRTALDLDPEFAPAWASLAATEMVRTIFGHVPPAEGKKATVEAARRALELDPTLGTAYGALGYTALYIDWDWRKARENLVRAVELDPTNAIVRHGYADLLLVEGKPEESLAQVELGRQYDPLNPIANGVVLGHLFFVHRYDELLAEADRLATVLPNLGNLSGYRYRALWYLGRRDEALEVLRQRWTGRAPELLEALDRGAARGGPRGAMVTVGEALERGGADPLDVAQFYALGGDADRAMAMLERAYTAHAPFLLHIKADPAYDGLHDDPRFRELTRRIGFP